MQLKFNLRNHIALVADAHETILVQALVDLGDLFEFNGIPEEAMIDLRELLARERAIALIWDADQVLSHYSHLTRDEAWSVLQECERRHDAERGLSWDEVGEAVAELFPDPDGFLQPDRVLRCERALHDYADSDEAANLTDLLADAMHWCRRKGLSFDRSLTSARMHFDHEAGGA